VTGLLIVGFVIVALGLYGVDRAVKARAQVRRLRTMTDRLDAAATRAERQEEKRQAVAEASAALTSVMPAIERPPLTLPGTASHDAAAAAETSDAETPDDDASTPSDAAPRAAARPQGGREHTRPHEHRPAHPGREPSDISRHVGTVRVRPDGEDRDDRGTRPIGALADSD
jgi:hypothetical protein